jgi:MoaA/NifB/PqqE/SkfB family radical SAM enzyme
MTSKIQRLSEIANQFEIIAEINLDTWFDHPIYRKRSWMIQTIESVYQTEFKNNQRIIFTLSKSLNLVIEELQSVLNLVDISNFFVIVLTKDIDYIEIAKQKISKISSDATTITFVTYEDDTTVTIPYQYNSQDPTKISLKDLSQQHQSLLTASKTFCMYPWVHLHAYPTGEAWPCCQAEMSAGPIGNLKQNTIKEVWNSPRMKQLRTNMINGVQDPACVRCYEQEDSGFFSGRRSANKHHGHHISRVDKTQEDGHYDDFQMTYWDIRFSNLCNLSCRSCGHIFSSSWYQDQVKLAGEDWAKKNRPLNIAGRSATDMWEQLLPHMDYVEQIYFAGGEPLMMDEHYRILEELERRGRFDVRLIYNTNFTQIRLKDRVVFDYWRRFDSVAVGASLDAMGPRAEYIRRGTDWDKVQHNREQMLEICPRVDFYISPTLSIMNAWHLPDFHRAWVDLGLIRPQDLNVNILQDPAHLRIDIAPMKYKQRLRVKFEEHLAWLRPQDPLNRATVGFESAVNFMMATDNTGLIPKFWHKTRELDTIRGENCLDALPELEALDHDHTAR